MADEQKVQSIVKTKLSLVDAVKKMSEVKFDFVVVGTEMTAPNEKGETQKVFICRLFDSIPYVRGSQKIPMKDGSLKNLEKNDVTEIKVLESNAGSANFDMLIDEVSGEVSGTYKGSDLLLDISKSQFEVWLTDKTFASLGQGIRNANQASRLSSLQNRLTNPAAITTP
jgi:hypothetical protein